MAGCRHLLRDKLIASNKTALIRTIIVQMRSIYETGVVTGTRCDFLKRAPQPRDTSSRVRAHAQRPCVLRAKNASSVISRDALVTMRHQRLLTCGEQVRRHAPSQTVFVALDRETKPTFPHIMSRNCKRHWKHLQVTYILGIPNPIPVRNNSIYSIFENKHIRLLTYGITSVDFHEALQGTALVMVRRIAAPVWGIHVYFQGFQT